MDWVKLQVEGKFKFLGHCTQFAGVVRCMTGPWY